MTMAHDLIIDQFSPTVDRQTRLSTWYAQGHSDGLGDRLLMFDNTTAPSWEILRFRPALAHDYRFAHSLRERVEQLASFHHPAFPVVRPIKELGHEDGLAVVSTYVAGARLSEALKKPRSPAFGLRLVKQLVPALTALQQHKPGMAHGAVDADRIVVTAAGQLMIREHMIGVSLASLELSAARLWAEFGILAAPSRSTIPLIDGRTAVIQLGLVTWSLLAGRRLGPEDYPHRIGELLDAIASRTPLHALGTFHRLRCWLERALRVDGDFFRSAQEANESLADLRDELEQPEDYFNSLGADASTATAVTVERKEPPAFKQAPRGQLITPRFGSVAEEAPDLLSFRMTEVPDEAPNLSEMPPEAAPARRQVVAMAIRWVAAAVAVLAVAEGLFIGRLLYKQAANSPATAQPPATTAQAAPSATPPASARAEILAAGSMSLPVTVPQPPRTNQVAADIAGPPAARRAAETLPQKPAQRAVTPPVAPPVPSASLRSGAFRLSSSIELHVLDGDRVLGSSGEGPIVAPAGRHEFEFVNSAIGYRERRVVDVTPGQVTSISIAVPNGILNINALPWATVSIDGNSYGETPLGNLPIAPGEHEIVFRHPQFGERRQKTLVKAGTTTRVAIDLQR